MPRITLNVSEIELKYLRRLARHEKQSEARTAATLMHMTMRMIQREERVGIYYGPAPKTDLPCRRASTVHHAKVAARCAAWTREERDVWILTGVEPAC
jgi:hypothetical protein